MGAGPSLFPGAGAWGIIRCGHSSTGPTYEPEAQAPWLSGFRRPATLRPHSLALGARHGDPGGTGILPVRVHKSSRASEVENLPWRRATAARTVRLTCRSRRREGQQMATSAAHREPRKRNCPDDSRLSPAYLRSPARGFGPTFVSSSLFVTSQLINCILMRIDGRSVH